MAVAAGFAMQVFLVFAAEASSNQQRVEQIGGQTILVGGDQEISRGNLANSGSRDIDPTVRRLFPVNTKQAISSPYVVGAFYFSAFAPSSNAVAAGTLTTYGRRNDWWGGVKDFYGAEPGIPKDRRGWEGDWRGLKPVIGYYDQTSVATLRKHILQASDAGLTFFCFYWYWSNKSKGEKFPEALQAFQAGNVEGRLKFNLALYAHPWDQDMVVDPTNQQTVVAELVQYFARKDYLRLPDGRPVFVLGDYRNIADAEGRKCTDVECHIRAANWFLAALKEKTRAVLGVEPFVQVQVGSPGWDTLKNSDGVSCLVPPIILERATTYPKLDDSVFAPLSRSGKPVSPCMFQNFDERPRQDILIKDRGAIRYLVGKSDAAFRGNLAMTKKYMDLVFEKTHHPSSRIVYLYAWNEWHEGGILEPNVATGAHDLKLVSEVFNLRWLPSLCLERGSCN